MTLVQSLTDSLVSMIGWFDSKEKATEVVVLMFGLFVVSAGWIAYRHLTFLRHLSGATSSVRLALSNKTWAPADRLTVIDRDLKAKEVVGDAWAHYRASLRDDPQRAGKFVNLVDPAEWFAVANLKGSGYEKWTSTWASVFLCLGLLFTFVGLSAALMKVGNVDDAVRLREGINGILSVSSAKFITSIFGILLFIAWTFFGRWVGSGQHAAARQLAVEVQSLTTLMTPEVMLMDQLLTAREQTDRMRTLADDVAVAFEARLNDGLGKRLDAGIAAFPEQIGASIRPVVEAIEGMGGSLSKGADDALGRVAERLEQAAEMIRLAQGGIGNSGDEFGAKIAQAATTMSETVARMAEAIDTKLAGLEGRIASVNDALQQGASSISGVTQGLSEATSTALAQALATISQQAANGAEQARQQSQAAMEPLLQSMRTMADLIRERAAEGSGSLVEGSKSAATVLTAAAGGISNQMAELESRIGRVDEAMARGAQAITGVSAGMSDAANATLTRALEAIADQAARGTEQAREQSVAAMQPLMQTMQTIADELRKRAEEGSGHIVAGSKSAAALLTSAAGGIGDRMAELEARIGRVDEAMARGAQAISGVTAGMSDAASSTLARALEAIAEQAARGAQQTREQSLAAMQPLMQTMQSVAEELRARAAEGSGHLATGGKSAAEALTTAASGIGATMANLEARIGSIDAALTKGSQSISNVGEDLARATSTALGESLKTISGEAARGAEQARQQSQAAMEPLLKGLQSLTEQIREQALAGSGHLVDGGRSAAETLAAAAQSMSDRLTAATREASANLQSAAQSMADRMDAAVVQFRSVELAVAAHVGHLQKTGATITAAGSTFDIASGQLRLAAEPIKLTLASVEAAARNAAEALDATTGLQGRLQEATTAMQSSIGDATSKLSDVSRTAGTTFESYRARFENTDVALGKTVEGLVGGVTGLGNAAEKMISGMQGQLADALGKLGMGVGELKDVVDDMQATASKLEELLARRERIGVGMR